MTTDDMWIKVKVNDQGLVVTNRIGNPIIRCMDTNPKRACKRLKTLLDALAEEGKTKGMLPIAQEQIFEVTA